MAAPAAAPAHPRAAARAVCAARAQRRGQRAARQGHLTMPAPLTYIALLHFPVYDRNKRIVATAITNLDIHDLARSTRTYGLAGYFVVTPLERQRELATRIVGYWNEEEGPRAEALKKVRIASELKEVVEQIEREHGRKPRVIATSARKNG